MHYFEHIRWLSRLALLLNNKHPKPTWIVLRHIYTALLNINHSGRGVGNPLISLFWAVGLLTATLYVARNVIHDT